MRKTKTAKTAPSKHTMERGTGVLKGNSKLALNNDGHINMGN